jgi:hypothetical protein
MTVAFGFTSPGRQCSLLGSDDLEGMSGRRHEKVSFLFKRFLVGGLGNNTVFSAANLLDECGDDNTSFSDDSEYKSPQSTSDLCDQILEVLPVVVSHTHRAFLEAVHSKTRTLDQFRSLVAQPSKIVFIDTQLYKMSLADFGDIYPPKERYKYHLQDLPSERVFRFGIDNPVDLGSIPAEAVRRPFAWCGSQVKEANRWLTSIGRGGLLGNLGSCYLVKPSKALRRSCFASKVDLALRYFPA